MTLPEIAIPEIPIISTLPLPELSHPVVIHFAVALPIIVILIELFNLFARKYSVGFLSFLLMALFSILLFATYLTGSGDAKLAKDMITANSELSSLFQQHKIEGVYIFYGSFLLLFIKIVSVMARKVAVRVLFLLFLIVYSAILFNVAYKGTKLVYEYGVNVKTSPATHTTPKALPAEATKDSNSSAN
jgi:uncharacterized membrane protein